MKYRSKKGTVINIPDGLTPGQIKAIKADADSGYGTRAQNTANSLGKKNGNSGGKILKTPKGETPIVDPATGTVDTSKALESVRTANNQTITDQYGNKRTIRIDPATGEATVIDEAGGTAQTFKNLAEAAAKTFNGDVDRRRAEEATYGTLTRYYDRDQAREMEAQKQELAQRGIPYDPAAAQDPNSKNLYGRTIGGISEKYRGMKDVAAQQAVISGNQAYATDSAARDSFLNAMAQGATTFGGQFGQYQSPSGQDDKDILSMSAQQYAAKYGLTLAEAQSKRDDATRRAAIAKSGSGNSGGSSAGGFELQN